MIWSKGCRTPKCGTVMRVMRFEDEDGTKHKNWTCPKCGSVQAVVNFTERSIMGDEEE
jgi:ribosomal protein S27AE